MTSPEIQHNLPVDLQRLRLQQLRTTIRQRVTQNPASVDQRTPAANHANVVWAVADEIAFSAKHSVLQGDRVQRSAGRRVIKTRFSRHRALGRGPSGTVFCRDLASANGPSVSSFVCSQAPQDQIVAPACGRGRGWHFCSAACIWLRCSALRAVNSNP